MADLVREPAAEPRDAALVAEELVHPHRVLAEELGELLGRHLVGLGPEARGRHLGIGPHAGAVLLPGLGRA